jgi:hypothetical protein
LTRSDAGEKSEFSTPDVNERHFSTLNAVERSKFWMPDVDQMHFSTLNADGEVQVLNA